MSAYSICPKNWKLPTSGSSGQFQALYAAYGSNKTTFDSSWHPAYVGYFDSGSFYDSGARALWWSSTSTSSAYARRLYEDTSGVINLSNGNGRSYGFSVRCVAKYRYRFSLHKSASKSSRHGKGLWRNVQNAIPWNPDSNRNSFDSSWHPAYVGRFGNGSFELSGTNVYWWGSTSNSSTLAYGPGEYTSGYINPSLNHNRRYGFSVRCFMSAHSLALCPQRSVS